MDALPDPILRVDSLTKSYGKDLVLAGLDLEIETGEVVVIIGPSGSGKTTLLRCIAFLTDYQGGEIVFRGRRLWYKDRECREPSDEATALSDKRNFGIVFQSFNLFPHLRVLENITLAPRVVAGTDPTQAAGDAVKLLARVGLADKAMEWPATLSGGQQQRVAIARALAMGPDVMLFDEITSALDPELTSEVLNVIRDLARDGMTMIIATHEMQFALDVADRVVFIDNGSIIEQGPSSAMLLRPSTSRLREFLRHFDRTIARNGLD